MRRMRRLLDRGAIRRVAAVPNHYALGFRANGMSVWDVDDTRVDELGARVGAARVRLALLPAAARAARLVLQPVRDGARADAARGGRAGGDDRGAPRGRRAVVRHPVQHRDPEEVRHAARGEGEMFRVSQFMREIVDADAGRPAARSARPGRDLEPHPPLQPHVQALLLGVGRPRLPGRALDGGGVRGDGRPEARSGCRC